jgi:hypothetical protein
LFLSTDAGGVGLNLQHASVVANMDLPWNPAVLEQRIGRVHRLGQKRPVRVVHFIAKGTIEEGMLGLLSFKKSVFTGVLDGGAKEVFLGGTRLKQFMDSVDQAAGTIPAPMPSETQLSAPFSEPAAAPPDAPAPGAAQAPGSGPRASSPAAQPPAPMSVPTPTGAERQPQSPVLSPAAVGDLLTAGAALLTQLGQSLRQASTDDGKPALSNLIGRDEATGQTYLKLPLPKEDVLGPLLNLLRDYVDRSR